MMGGARREALNRQGERAIHQLLLMRGQSQIHPTFSSCCSCVTDAPPGVLPADRRKKALAQRDGTREHDRNCRTCVGDHPQLAGPSESRTARRLRCN
jgi:hypothetical protein